jgi:hypothetical protein
MFLPEIIVLAPDGGDKKVAHARLLFPEPYVRIASLLEDKDEDSRRARLKRV